MGATCMLLRTNTGVPQVGMLDSNTRDDVTLSPLQEWEGYVVGVERDHMIANLVNLTLHERHPSATVEIPLEELESSDVERLRPGLIFRWAVGYVRMSSGTKMRGSRIIFRDLPQWTKRELTESKRRASEIADYFAHRE
jgi:hypothetical protein